MRTLRIWWVGRIIEGPYWVGERRTRFDEIPWEGGESLGGNFTACWSDKRLQGYDWIVDYGLQQVDPREYTLCPQ